MKKNNVTEIVQPGEFKDQLTIGLKAMCQESHCSSAHGE